MEAIQAATRDAVRSVGRGEKRGTLELGKQADLLVVVGSLMPCTGLSPLISP